MTFYWYLSNMKNLDKILEKLYNTLGNLYLTENFDTEPFEFTVKIRRGDRNDDLQDYIVEVYSVPELPERFTYKSNSKNGIHISVLRGKFKEYLQYVDTTFGDFRKTVGIDFMNRK
jgi:hypothetical protein